MAGVTDMITGVSQVLLTFIQLDGARNMGTHFNPPMVGLVLWCYYSGTNGVYVLE